MYFTSCDINDFGTRTAFVFRNSMNYFRDCMSKNSTLLSAMAKSNDHFCLCDNPLRFDLIKGGRSVSFDFAIAERRVEFLDDQRYIVSDAPMKL
jgi:hypothetical protein